MMTPQSLTMPRNRAFCQTVCFCMVLMIDLIGLGPAFAESDVQRLAAMQPMNSVELAIEFPGFRIERDQIKSDGRRYLTASHPVTGLNLSIAMEPIQGRASAAGCVKHLQHLRQSLTIRRGQDISLTATPAVHRLEYTLREFHGVRLDQKSIYACMAEGQVYANIHLSKVRSSAADAALFEEVIQSIHLQPGHGRSVTMPSASAAAPTSHVENISYASDGQAKAIAP